MYEKHKSYYSGKKFLSRPLIASKNAKIVVLDFDGTLTAPHYLRTIWKQIWCYLGYSNTECEKYHKQYSDKLISHQQWCDITAKHFREKGFIRKDLENLSKNVKLLDGFEDTVKYLRDNGILMYIVSGSIREFIREVLGSYCEYFEHISAN